MRQREHIEGDLIVVMARIYDLAECGLDGSNIAEIRRLQSVAERLLHEAEDRPQVKILQFPGG